MGFHNGWHRHLHSYHFSGHVSYSSPLLIPKLSHLFSSCEHHISPVPPRLHSSHESQNNFGINSILLVSAMPLQHEAITVQVFEMHHNILLLFVNRIFISSPASLSTFPNLSTLNFFLTAFSC